MIWTRRRRTFNFKCPILIVSPYPLQLVDVAQWSVWKLLYQSPSVMRRIFTFLEFSNKMKTDIKSQLPHMRIVACSSFFLTRLKTTCRMTWTFFFVCFMLVVIKCLPEETSGRRTLVYYVFSHAKNVKYCLDMFR